MQEINKTKDTQPSLIERSTHRQKPKHLVGIRLLYVLLGSEALRVGSGAPMRRVEDAESLASPWKLKREDDEREKSPAIISCFLSLKLNWRIPPIIFRIFRYYYLKIFFICTKKEKKKKKEIFLLVSRAINGSHNFCFFFCSKKNHSFRRKCQ